MKRNWISKPVLAFWGGGILFSLAVILISGGSVGSFFLRLFVNTLLVTLFVGIGWFLWKQFLAEKKTAETPEKSENEEEDEIVLESVPEREYTENGRSGENGSAKAGDRFADYQYKSDVDTKEIHHLDSRNPYEMSDSLLRKFKTEEEDSLAKFKADFQSPEEIAKAIRTQLHRDE